MTLREIMTRIDRSQKDEYQDLSEIAESCGIYEYVSFEGISRIQSYFFHKWLCTDTMVGARAYFLDDDCIAISTQECRKCDENFEWVSREAFLSARNYILSLIEPNVPEPTIVNLDHEVGIGRSIYFSNEIVSKIAIYIPTGITSV